MCDFRDIKKIKIVKTGEIKKVKNYPGLLNTSTGQWETGDRKPIAWKCGDPPPGAEEGMYTVGCSGAGNQYFDGINWLDEVYEYNPDGHYEVIEFDHTHGPEALPG